MAAPPAPLQAHVKDDLELENKLASKGLKGKRCMPLWRRPGSRAVPRARKGCLPGRGVHLGGSRGRGRPRERSPGPSGPTWHRQPQT